MFPQQEQGCPYPGARPHFLVTELDDDRALSSLVRETCSILAVPSVLEGKKKKASGEKEAGALRRLPAGNGCWRGRLFSGSFRSGQRGEVFFRPAAAVCVASLSDSVNLSTACVRDLRSDSDILRPFALRCSRAEIFY